MTDQDREPRDPRGSDDPRDARDPRESDDPRDTRDPRQPGDPRLGDERSGIPHFVKALAVGVIVGLITIVVVAWQLSHIDSRQQQRACERAVAGRQDGRAVWLYLVARDPERRDDPDVIAFVEFLNDRLPPLECVNHTPTPVTETTEE